VQPLQSDTMAKPIRDISPLFGLEETLQEQFVIVEKRRENEGGVRR
jgi:hypothetical protein